VLHCQRDKAKKIKKKKLANRIELFSFADTTGAS
jgi:hypothetical protein